MSRLVKILLVGLTAMIGFAVADAALAGKNVMFGENNSERDISSKTDQSGSAASGDAVGGQVVGVVSAGDASVDATNRSEDVDVESGEASASNDADGFTGQLHEGGFGANNEAQGEIESSLAQTASAASGDAVAGQVAGVVTSAGGSADLALANTSEDVDGESGDSNFFNETDEFVGQQIEGEEDDP
jgi:hypothetical protein